MYICCTELITTTEAFASKAECKTIIQCALDLEVHLKSECLRMQGLAQEEHTTYLHNEISKLRQSQPKLKASGSNPQGQPKGVTPKNNHTKHASKSPSKSAKPLP